VVATYVDGKNWELETDDMGVFVNVCARFGLHAQDRTLIMEMCML